MRGLGLFLMGLVILLSPLSQGQKYMERLAAQRLILFECGERIINRHLYPRGDVRARAMMVLFLEGGRVENSFDLGISFSRIISTLATSPEDQIPRRIDREALMSAIDRGLRRIGTVEAVSREVGLATEYAEQLNQWQGPDVDFGEIPVPVLNVVLLGLLEGIRPELRLEFTHRLARFMNLRELILLDSGARLRIMSRSAGFGAIVRRQVHQLNHLVADVRTFRENQSRNQVQVDAESQLQQRLEFESQRIDALFSMCFIYWAGLVDVPDGLTILQVRDRMRQMTEALRAHGPTGWEPDPFRFSSALAEGARRIADEMHRPPELVQPLKILINELQAIQSLTDQIEGSRNERIHSLLEETARALR